MWKGKRILVGITGGIAAYKTPLLVREFIKLGAEVKCIMTPASFDFVTPLTLATVSKNEVYHQFYDSKTGIWANHVELALWADVFVIAPLTASSLSKMVMGHSDNLLLASYLSAKCPVFVAPAMDLDMYEHFSTRENLQKLTEKSVHIIPANSGELASGLVGQGRMAEPIEICEFIANTLVEKDAFYGGKKVLITAGPTFESIDPVRFIGNHSSGKMGVALAYELAKRGAQIQLILGPSNICVNDKNIHVTPVQSAIEMFDEVKKHWSKSDIGIFAAAVADYRPKEIASIKLKKSEDEMTIVLTKNPDLLFWAGKNKSENQLLVGFALETNNEEANAQEKRAKKNADFLVLNSLADVGAGFKHDTNCVSIVNKDNKFTKFELLSKVETAKKIVDFIKK